MKKGGDHEPADISKVSQGEIELCTRIFNEFDRYSKNWITASDLEMALVQVGIEFSHSNIFHKMVSELDNQTGRLSFTDFMKIYISFKKAEKNEQQQKEEALDAYVAMGGEEDGGGNIDSDYLIDVIKNQFKMSIDIEGLLKQIDEDGSGEIEFDEFQALLEKDGGNPEIEDFKEWFSIDH